MVAGARGTGDARGTVGGLVAGGLATYVDAEDGAGGRPRQARYRVEAACTAQGLLAALVRSKPAVARAFEAGALARGGATLRRQDALVPGDVVTLALAPADAPHAGAGGAGGAAGRRGREELRVLYRDPFLMAVDKPAGILVHGDGTGARTLTDGVAALLGREGVPAAASCSSRWRRSSSRRSTRWWRHTTCASATWPWWRARLTRACAGWTRRSGATGTTRGACA